jgi:hypothetical protein
MRWLTLKIIEHKIKLKLRDILVSNISHTVDEDHLPATRNKGTTRIIADLASPSMRVHNILIGGNTHTLESLRHALGVTVAAPIRYLLATWERIDRRVTPSYGIWHRHSFFSAGAKSAVATTSWSLPPGQCCLTSVSPVHPQVWQV